MQWQDSWVSSKAAQRLVSQILLLRERGANVQVKQMPILLVVSTLLAASQSGNSQGYEAPVDDVEAVTFAYADVLRSDAILESVQESRPREVCRDISSSRSTRYENTTAGTVIGAIVGAAIGNQVGDGNGRRAATVAGAVAGGAIGREADASNNPQGERRSTRTECEIVDDYVERKEVVGYDVQYRFRGEVFSSRLSYDPGEKLRIRVAISPATP
jgi:uncharacterized protein YcfJ